MLLQHIPVCLPSSTFAPPHPQSALLQALERLLALVDPSDEAYSVQRALVAGDAAFYLTELLSDPAPHVAVRAAEAVAALCRHSAPARARLAGGPLMGLDSKVERVSLNPVQSGGILGVGACLGGSARLHLPSCWFSAMERAECAALCRQPVRHTCLPHLLATPARHTFAADFVDSGAMAALVPMLLQRQEAPREASLEAVGALCSFNQVRWPCNPLLPDDAVAGCGCTAAHSWPSSACVLLTIHAPPRAGWQAGSA